MSRNEGRFNAADDLPTPEDEGTSAVAASAANTQFNWALPTEFVELPSKGKFYPPGHPLHNEETIEIKYMTAKEEDILTDRSLLKKGIAVDRVLENIIVNNNGIDICTAKNSTARAIFDGVVSSVAIIPGEGKVVMIRHGEYLSVYSYLK